MVNPFNIPTARKKNPFDATPLGIAANTVAGLPQAAVGMAKSIGQGFARSIGSTALTVAKPFGGVDKLAASEIKNPFGQELYRNFFGEEPVKLIEDRIAEAEIAIKRSPFAQKIGVDKLTIPTPFGNVGAPIALAFGGVFGITALDLTPFGALEKNAVKELVKATTPQVTTAILRSMKVPEEIIPRFAQHFAEAKTPAEVQDGMDIMKGVMGVRTKAVEAPVPPKSAPKAGGYRVIHQGGVIKTVEGEPVKIVDDVDTFLHKDENGNWVVSEATTGRNLSGGGFENSSFAVKAARENIETVGEAKFKKLIADNQLTPPKSAPTAPIAPKADPTNFKSAEEYVNSKLQNTKLVDKTTGEPLTVYTGQVGDFGLNKPFNVSKGDMDNMYGEGIYFSPEKKVAQQYATGGSRPGKVYEVNLDIKNPLTPRNPRWDNFIRSTANAEDKTAWLKRNGFDGVVDIGAGKHTKQIMVLDNSQVIHKSQLTDLWKKAQGVSPLLAEARKYKSAEEFVKAQPTVYRAEGGGIDPAQGKALLAEGRHFASDAEYPKRFGTVSEYVAKPDTKIFDASGLDFKEIRAKLGLSQSNYLSPTEYTKALKENGYDILKYDGTYKSTGKPFVHTVEITPNSFIPKSQLTDIWNKATSVAPKSIPKVAQPLGEGAPLAAKADQLHQALPATLQKEVSSLEAIITQRATEVKQKVNALDYFRTPDRVLEKIGFANESKLLRQGYESYIKELPKNIDKITAWSKEVPKGAAKTIFQYLDGDKVSLSPAELKVAGEMKSWLEEWAKRLKLPQDNRITNYITHIFDKELIAKEFDEDLAKIITDKIPGSVYDPFLLKRLGAKGYKQNVFEALDAYVKRATRKVNLDPALDAIQAKAGSSLELSNVEASQFKYIQRYVSGVNMRPTELDNILDNTIKNVVGYKYGQRPVTYLTKLLRHMTYRGMLGLNPGSALRNVSQGINTYAVLGEKYTTIGYVKLLNRGAMKELADEGIFNPGFIQDRALSSTKKTMETIDKGLFSFFEAAERINRGSAYFGAKSKAIAQGKTEQEAVDFAKSVVRKTQFAFGSIDTPVAIQSDIVKTLAQFQNFTLKQVEFLTEMAKDKNFVGLLRYAVAGTAFVYTIGKAFGMQPSDLVPSFRFGTPPSLKFPGAVVGAVLNTPTKYGKPRDLGQKASDVAKSSIGLIPAGTQINKSVQGLKAFNQGKDTTPTGKTRYVVPQDMEHFLQAILFGKSAFPEAQKYYDSLNAPAGSKTSTKNPFNP